jgi:thiamine biosynthesis lipoprotein
VSAPEPPQPGAPPRTEVHEGWTRVLWHALGGPCELLVDGSDAAHASTLGAVAAAESRRIEHKFSRYRTDSVLHAINASAGAVTRVDDETAGLLDYAAECHAMSDGRFDITSGVLRRVWTFDGSDRVPGREAVRDVLRLVGWTKVRWQRPELTLPAGMELDLGGLGKEYAVDRAAAEVGALARSPFLVNFGGDLFAPAPRADGRPWSVGVDDPERTGRSATHLVQLERGGLATSGDARRFVMWNGRRLGHILDPRTGWPVTGAPHSVTVLAATCLEAGTLATLAILAGPDARRFLEDEGVLHEIA